MVADELYTGKFDTIHIYMQRHIADDFTVADGFELKKIPKVARKKVQSCL